MKLLTFLGTVGAMSATLMTSQALAADESGRVTTQVNHSSVSKVIANSNSYKWGRVSSEVRSEGTEWASTAAPAHNFKWGKEVEVTTQTETSYASNADFEWSAMGNVEQSGLVWRKPE